MTQFEVRAISRRGAKITLGRGYPTREEAEDFVCRHGDYRKVEVVEVEVQPRPKRTSIPFAKQCDLAFATIERAAAAGERCPQSGALIDGGIALTSLQTSMLAKAGKIKIEVYKLNWRVVEIMVGPHRGMRTALPPGQKAPPYVTISKYGRQRWG